jgi:hypothetical protein
LAAAQGAVSGNRTNLPAAQAKGVAADREAADALAANVLPIVRQIQAKAFTPCTGAGGGLRVRERLVGGSGCAGAGAALMSSNAERLGHPLIRARTGEGRARVGRKPKLTPQQKREGDPPRRKGRGVPCRHWPQLQHVRLDDFEVGAHRPRDKMKNARNTAFNLS